MEWITLAWKFRNEIGIALIALILVVSGLYINYVLKDRQKLKEDIAKLQAELILVQKQQTLNEDIVNAIQKIKIQSVNNVKVIEASKPDPSKPSALIPSGVLPSVLTSGTFRNQSSSNAGSNVGPSK